MRYFMFASDARQDNSAAMSQTLSYGVMEINISGTCYSLKTELDSGHIDPLPDQLIDLVKE